MTIKYIKIYGERNSGVLELATNLNSNKIRAEVLSGNYKKGWQHGEPLYNFNYCHHETLFICIIRDLDSWLTEMYNKPYHLKVNSFEEFIKDKTINIETKLNHDTIINPFEKNKTLLELRYSKYQRFKKLLKFKNCILVNLSYLINNLDDFYQILKNEFNLEFDNNLKFLNKKMFKNKLKEYNKNIIKIDNILENEINNLSILSSKYNYKYNEYFDILKNTIIKNDEYPKNIYITSDTSLEVSDSFVFCGYNHFTNKYNLDIMDKMNINFIDFVRYLSLYYDYKPKVLFEIIEENQAKNNLINNHMKNKCFINNCPFCSKNLMTTFINFTDKLSETNKELNKYLNFSVNYKNRFKNLFNQNIQDYDFEKENKFFNLQIVNRNINNLEKQKDFLGLITRCKDEKYIELFVSYYKSQGVSKIIIIDDNSKKGIYQNLKDDDQVIIYYEENIINKNTTCNIYNEHRFDFKWLIFVDVDEFIKPTSNKKIIDELKTTFKDVDCIKIPWILMGFKNQQKYPKNILIENTFRMNYDNIHKEVSSNFKFRNRDNKIECKCIFKPIFFDKISVKNNRSTDHYPLIDKNFTNIIIKDSVENKITKLNSFYEDLNELKIKNAFLLCYHYRINSIEHVQDKIKNNLWYKQFDINDIVKSDISEIEDKILKNYALNASL